MADLSSQLHPCEWVAVHVELARTNGYTMQFVVCSSDLVLRFDGCSVHVPGSSGCDAERLRNYALRLAYNDGVNPVRVP
jgi:hypothetical protein